MAIQIGHAASYIGLLNKTTGNSNTSGSPAAATQRPQAENTDRSTQISALGQTVADAADVYAMDTGKGERNLSLGTYFSDGYSQPSLSLDGLLLPSEKNVRALQDHISSVFPDFLAANGIPEVPERIRYDSEGKMVLPPDYPYADELRSALENDPAMARELSTANALSSHLAALKELEPFHEEYAQAESQAQINAVIEKYSHLLSDRTRYPEIALLFTEGGSLSITADGATLV